jgi:predicted enzyme related to lactoylglutathione lyase
MRVRGYAAGTPCWVELVTPDPGGAAAFYGGLFGWAGADAAPAFERAGLAVAGLRGGPGDQPAGWLTYVATDDLAGTVAEAEAAGGRVLAPPYEVPGRGSAAVLSDPAGAVFGLWQRTGFAGAQVANEPGTICWTDLATPDLDAAERFYGRVFGWRRKAVDYLLESDYDEWHSAGRPVAGLRAFGENDPPGGPPYWMVTLMVADCRATAEHAERLGGRLLVPCLDMSVGTYAAVADPAGAVFGAITLAPELAVGLL